MTLLGSYGVPEQTVICEPTFALALRFQIEPPLNQPLLKRPLEDGGESIDEVPLLKLRAAPNVAAVCKGPALKVALALHARSINAFRQSRSRLTVKRIGKPNGTNNAN
jgi:hypothetical protein